MFQKSVKKKHFLKYITKKLESDFLPTLYNLIVCLCKIFINRFYSDLFQKQVSLSYDK